MKVELTEGCIADTLEIDGFPFGDTQGNSLNGITENLLRYIRKQCKKDREYLQELLIATTERFGETEFLYTCEQCGDSVFKTTVDMTLKRKPYKKGLKEYLASFSVGEKREYDKVYAWRSIMGIASVMKKDFGCVFKLSWKDKSITRLV